jgi:DNA modification methylase
MLNNAKDIEIIAQSAKDSKRISGFTHNYYKYPACFSPVFVSTAIKLFSKPGGLVLDPYMGGGTTIVEAMAAGRNAVGTDLNSLSVFVTGVKTTLLNASDRKNIIRWLEQELSNLSYHTQSDDVDNLIKDKRTKNLNLLSARFIKKLIAAAIVSIESLENHRTKDFIRCAILKTGQWAIDSRRASPSLADFREKLKENIYQMLEGMKEFNQCIKIQDKQPYRKLMELNASYIDQAFIFSKRNLKVDLVVTSPPYPGIHILYHRWQIDGRRETPAPYWIAECNDGQGDSYYNFGNRQEINLNTYFETSLNTLKSIRRVMRKGAFIVQMLAFSKPNEHLPRYLSNMQIAGFDEVPLPQISATTDERIWRNVPNRRWHAALKGNTASSKEVVLIHKAT